MARDTSACDQMLEDDYIDMDISSTTFVCYTIASSPNSREFEFHLSSKEDSLPSPADELFYKGKLLPLHLPPRLQMVEKLLTNTTPTTFLDSSEDINNSKQSTYTTPLESCNISTTSSCYVSGELNPEDYYQYSSRLVQPHQKKSWSKKLKESSLGLKLKASRAYLKSLFSKSGCSDESCTISKSKDCSNRSMKAGKKNPFMQIKKEKNADEDTVHRRSFSCVINRHSSMKNSLSTASSSCSSSSSSFSSASRSNEHYGSKAMLKRSSSARSEAENPIQGAIAYCKKSQQLITGRKSLSDVGYCSISAARMAEASDNKDTPGICRG